MCLSASTKLLLLLFVLPGAVCCVAWRRVLIRVVCGLGFVGVGVWGWRFV
jgi:hypothetical protein